MAVPGFSRDFEEAWLYFQGEQEKAISAYLGLIEKEPANISVWVNLALAYRDLGLYTEAISSLRHASRISLPEKTTIPKEEVLDLLAWLYYCTGNTNGVENTFRQIISSEPKSLSGLFGLGRINIDRKNWLEAEKIFKKIVADNPDFANNKKLW